MDRLTTKMKDGTFSISEEFLAQGDGAYSGIAADKLARFELMCEAIQKEQKALSEKIERLRIEGKTRTYQFRELTAKRLTNATVLSLFKTYGLGESFQ